RGLMVGRSARCADCAAVLGRGAVPQNSLRAPSERCAQTAAASQMLKRACPSAGTPAPRPALLAAPQIALAPGPRPRRVEPLVEHPTGRLIPQPPFGLSLSKPGAALRQAQRERVRGVERAEVSATARWVAGAGPAPHRGLGRTMAYPLPLTRPRRPSQRPNTRRAISTTTASASSSAIP